MLFGGDILKTAISLFTGAGGMDIGFEKAGFNIIFSNEIMKNACDTYIKNHPNANMIFGDINLNLDKLSNYNDVDLVFGGPPCQGFSVAGKMNPNDERSQLIFTFLKVVEIVKPKMFVMENVKALGVLGKWDEVRKKYMDIVESLGYICKPILLNATEYNVSQKRERVFFIGVKKEYSDGFAESINSLIEKHKSRAKSVRELLKDLGRAGTSTNPLTCTAKITFASNPVMRKSPYSGMYFNGQGRPINVDSYANTLPASMGGNKTPFVDEEYLYGSAEEDWVVSYHKGLLDKSIKPIFEEAPSRLRRITVREAARIQSFPDDYVFCGKSSQIYTQIGNAVPPRLAEAVARAVFEYLK